MYRFTHLKALALEEGPKNTMPLISAGGLGVQYRNLFTNEKYYQQEYFGEFYLVKKQIIDDEWVVTKETKDLQGYTCYKAIYYQPTMRGKQKVTAWFTPQISVPFGPSGFDGLPGLILQVQYGKNIITATKITFAQEELVIEPPTGKILENEEEVGKILAEYTGFDVNAHTKKLAEEAKKEQEKKKE